MVYIRNTYSYLACDVFRPFFEVKEQSMPVSIIVRVLELIQRILWAFTSEGSISSNFKPLVETIDKGLCFLVEIYYIDGLFLIVLFQKL